MTTPNSSNNSSFGLPKNAIWYRFTPRARFSDSTGFPCLRRHKPSDLRALSTIAMLLDHGANVTFYHVVDDGADFFCAEAANPTWRGPRYIPRFLHTYPEYAEARLAKAAIIYAAYNLRKRSIK